MTSLQYHNSLSGIILSLMKMYSKSEYTLRMIQMSTFRFISANSFSQVGTSSF